MRLHNYWRSSSSWRVRLALGLKGLEWEYLAVNLLVGAQRGAEHLTRSPAGTVPVLELDDGTCISQSVAICEYLEERWPTPPLLPTKPAQRAMVRAMVEQINSGTQPFQNLSCTSFVRDTLGADERLFVRHFVGEGMRALERLATPVAGLCIFGDTPTLADCFLVPQMYAARRFDVDLDACPTLLRIDAYLQSHPAFKAAAPDHQPDAPRP